jgi:multidrug efflux pump subunit AcrA (membrane-fusion protein)
MSALTRFPMRARVALGLVGMLGVGMVTVGLVDAGATSGASSSQYALVAEGGVTATAGAAGSVQSADSRDLAFGASGFVSKVYVKVGSKVKQGDRLAMLDQTKAKEDVAAAKAALAAAKAAVDGTDSTNAMSSTTTVDGAPISLTGYAAPTGTSTTPTPTSSASTPSKPSAPPSKPSTTPTTSTRPPTTGPGAPGGGSAPGGTGRGSGGSGGPGGSGGSGGSGKSGTGGNAPSPEELQAQEIQAQNKLDQAEQELSGTVIKAPIDGTVLTVNGQAGDQASPNSVFITVGELTELQLQAEFSQNDRAKLRTGQDAKITLSALPGKTYAGTVAHIDENATTSDKLVKYGVMIAFDDLPAKVLIGQSGTVSVTTASVGDALYVPASAVRTGPKGTYTVQVRHGNTTATRAVQIGVRGDAYVQIASGLSKGERVVTSGQPDGTH